MHDSLTLKLTFKMSTKSAEELWSLLLPYSMGKEELIKRLRRVNFFHFKGKIRNILHVNARLFQFCIYILIPDMYQM